MNTQDLILAINAGKSTDIQAAFNEVMNTKLTSAIEAYREAVVEDAFGIADQTEEE